MFDHSYQVKINLNTSESELAILTPASQSDMPVDWTCDWVRIWSAMDTDCQAIVKLEYQNQIWGLMRYGVYPYPGTPNFVVIEHLEANPTSLGKAVDRFLRPIGKWFILVRYTGCQLYLYNHRKCALGDVSISRKSYEVLSRYNKDGICRRNQLSARGRWICL